MDDNHREMRELADRLNETARKYYVDNDPVISDAQWDEMYARLAEMEKAAGFRLPDSPTRRVGADPLPAFAQHRHMSRLWSMDKVQSRDELFKWFARAESLCLKADSGLLPLRYGLEYKFDGLTINLTYDGGLLVNAATRGNGEVGEAILPQARTIRDIPLRIPYKGLMEIHGECVMRLSALREYNRTAQEPLKNARNGAAGALRNLNPQVTASRRLSTFFYEVGSISDPPFSDQAGMLAFIRENGFSASPCLLESDSPKEIAEAVDRIRDLRHTLDYLIDGVVVKVAHRPARAALGYTDKFPRWAVAYKFEAEESTTTLEQVTWEPGRTGKVTPLAHVAPVKFSGVTVRKATLNNWGDILRKRLCIGCTVWIRRSNDVIPEITGSVDDGIGGEPIRKPDRCPACGSLLVETGANLFCENRDGCKPQIVARLSHFASRDALDIDTLSDKTAELLVERCGVREPADLYSLSAERLLLLPGFKAKRAEKLLEAIGASRDCALDAFLFAVGIPGIGRATAREIALACGTLEEARTASKEKFLKIGEIGEVISENIVGFFRDPRNTRMLDRLAEAGVRPRPARGEAGGALEGRSFVVTGTLKTLSRQQAEDLVRLHGGVPSGSVSRKTACLVCGENPGSKLAKARELGIPVVDEESFLKMVGK